MADATPLATFSHYQASVAWLYFLLFIDSTFLRLGWPARVAAPIRSRVLRQFTDSL